MEINTSEISKNNNQQGKRGRTSNSANTSRVKELRNKLGLTQAAFAERLNRDSQMISHIERGTKPLYLPFAIEICKEFNVSLDWLYELSDEKSDPASNVIVNLQNILNFDFEKRTITIGRELADFLKRVSDAYNTKRDKNIPDDAFEYWIEGIKKEYNETMKEINGKEKLFFTYYLIDRNEYFREKTPKTVIKWFFVYT